tara:strand:- start:134 stop:1129 length:996 start_codon:yes stop_codon:yes gene_type:complete
MANSSFYKDKTILVAGASGFVGTHLSNKLHELGANVVATYNKRTPNDLAISSKLQCDFTKYDDCLKATQDVDYVFMCAANTSGAAVMEKTPLAHLTPNVVMNSQILAAAYENKVSKFCFISSNTVYPVTDFAVKEDDVNYEFFSKYFIVGWMKLFSEKMTEMYSKHIKTPMDTLVVRPGNLYGPNDKFTWTESKVIAALIRKCIERQNPLPVWGDGEDLKDFLYIDDFIEGLLTAFENSKEFETINIASSIPVTIKDIINIILEVEGCENTEVKFDTTMPTMLPKRLINTDKIRKLGNWEPKVPLEEGISKTIIWYKEYFKEKTPEEKYDN